MGFKNTIEIITKDIQELEKIVRNFENYSLIPAIELDLAMEKTRNLYELLLMIREYEREKQSAGLQMENLQNTSPETRMKKADIPEKSEERIEFVNQVVEKEKINIPIREKENAEQEPQEPVNPVEKKAPTLKEKIIAEKFQKQGDFINEKIGGDKSAKDVSSKIHSTPIRSISGSMGINDKFFFIRELFNGNAENFNIAMKTLDDASSFNEAYNYLLDTFEWDMDSETVQQLLSLIRRKFIHSGNE